MKFFKPPHKAISHQQFFPMSLKTNRPQFIFLCHQIQKLPLTKKFLFQILIVKLFNKLFIISGRDQYLLTNHFPKEKTFFQNLKIIMRRTSLHQ